MADFLRLYLHMLMLRAGPQHAPSSLPLLLLVGFGYILVTTSSYVLANAPLLSALQFVLIDLAVMLAIVVGGLHYRGYGQRTIQTLAALFGCGLLLNLMALPVSASIGRDTIDAATALLNLLLLVWSLVVVGRIFREAFSVTSTVGMLVALGYWIVMMQLASMMMWPAANEGAL